MRKETFLAAAALFAGSLTAVAQQPGNLPPPASAQTPAGVVPPAVAPSPAVKPAGPPRIHSLSLEVASEKHGGASHNADTKETSRLGYKPARDQEYGSSRSESLNITVDQAKLQVTVRNFGTVPDTAEVECYFFGERLGELAPKGSPDYEEKAAKQFIFDHPTQSVTVAAGASDVVNVESKELRTLTEKSTSTDSISTSSSKDVTGTRLRGWMVRLMADGKVLAIHGSTSTFEDLGKDEAKLTAYLALKPPQESGKHRSIGPFRPGR